ncbi:hypothetical protein BESB_054920 [Besnoitia besnoiti]|uniref:RAP domain-containing protein n=1 Tax=Besnoitia besnoiti TaxID=94643 RepID=A0A2A9MHV6_BESBE|nr:hypothetical protein BESB_054920 [Besnoitia besnoiti]PFH35841.1 hypothetical protein BESB_054920 [Besnoitia besnoiti]
MRNFRISELYLSYSWAEQNWDEESPAYGEGAGLYVGGGSGFQQSRHGCLNGPSVAAVVPDVACAVQINTWPRSAVSFQNGSPHFLGLTCPRNGAPIVHYSSAACRAALGDARDALKAIPASRLHPYTSAKKGSLSFLVTGASISNGHTDWCASVGAEGTKHASPRPLQALHSPTADHGDARATRPCGFLFRGHRLVHQAGRFFLAATSRSLQRSSRQCHPQGRPEAPRWAPSRGPPLLASAASASDWVRADRFPRFGSGCGRQRLPWPPAGIHDRGRGIATRQLSAGRSSVSDDARGAAEGHRLTPPWLRERRRRPVRMSGEPRDVQDGNKEATASFPGFRGPLGTPAGATRDCAGQWSVRALHGVTRLEDMWSLLQQHNLHRLSGVELANILLRLFALSSSTADNGRGDMSDARDAEHGEIQLQDVEAAPHSRKTAPWDRHNQRGRPEARLTRLREEMKRHPIFKDILSILPNKAGSLSASLSVALLHALAGFGLRPSTALLRRAADTITRRALLPMLGPSAASAAERKTPRQRVEEREALTAAELSQLWAACETLVPLRREQLFPALVELTVRQFSALATRWETLASGRRLADSIDAEKGTSKDRQAQLYDCVSGRENREEAQVGGAHAHRTPDALSWSKHRLDSPGGLAHRRSDWAELSRHLGFVAAVARAAAGIKLGIYHDSFVQALERVVTAVLRQGLHLASAPPASQPRDSPDASASESFNGRERAPRAKPSRGSRRHLVAPSCSAFTRDGSSHRPWIAVDVATILARLVYSLTKLKQNHDQQPCVGDSQMWSGRPRGLPNATGCGLLTPTEDTAGRETTEQHEATRNDSDVAALPPHHRRPRVESASQWNDGGDRCVGSSTDTEGLLENFLAFFAIAAERVLPVHSQLPQLLGATAFLVEERVEKMQQVLSAWTRTPDAGGQPRRLPDNHMFVESGGQDARSFEEAQRCGSDCDAAPEFWSMRSIAENLSCLLSVATQAIRREASRMHSLPNTVNLLIALDSLEVSRSRLVALNSGSESAGDCEQMNRFPLTTFAGSRRSPAEERNADVESVLQQLATRIHVQLSALKIPSGSTEHSDPEMEQHVDRKGAGRGASSCGSLDQLPPEASLAVKHVHLLENCSSLVRLLLRLNRRDTAELAANRVQGIIGRSSARLRGQPLAFDTREGLCTMHAGVEAGRSLADTDVQGPKVGHLAGGGGGSEWLASVQAEATRKLQELQFSREFRRQIQWADSVEEVLSVVDSATSGCGRMLTDTRPSQASLRAGDRGIPRPTPDLGTDELGIPYLDSLSLSSALHRLAVVKNWGGVDPAGSSGLAGATPRPRAGQGSVRSATSQRAEDEVRAHSTRLWHDRRMHKLLVTVFAQLPSMDHQASRILWAFEKLEFFEPSVFASLIKSSTASKGPAFMTGAGRTTEMEIPPDGVPTPPSPLEGGSTHRPATGAPAYWTASMQQQLPVRLFSRLSELAAAQEMDGTQLASALRVVANIKARGFFSAPCQATGDIVGMSALATAPGVTASSVDTLETEAVSRSAAASWPAGASSVECESNLRDSFRRRLLLVAPSLSALDASTALFSLASLGWYSEGSGDAPSCLPGEVGEAQDGVAQTSAGGDAVVGAVLRRLRMEISKCNAQAFTNAIWAVAVMASCRRRRKDQRQLKNRCSEHALIGEPLGSAQGGLDSLAPGDDATGAEWRHFHRQTENGDFLTGLTAAHDTDDLAVYTEPVALTLEEKLFLDTVRQRLSAQVPMLDKEALSMLLLAGLMLRWQEPELLLAAVRRALVLLRHAQVRRRDAQHIKRERGGKEHRRSAEDSPGSQPSFLASAGVPSALLEPTAAAEELQSGHENSRGTGELHSRVWAILAMLAQQSLNQCGGVSEVSGGGGERAEISTRAIAGIQSGDAHVTSAAPAHSPQGNRSPGKAGTLRRMYCPTLSVVEREAIGVLKADLELVLRRTGWPPPKDYWRARHAQSILLSLMTMQRDRVRLPELAAADSARFSRPSESARQQPPAGIVGDALLEPSPVEHSALLSLLETFVARSVEHANTELTGPKETGSRSASPLSRTEPGNAAGERPTVARQRQLVHRWVKRLSLLLFALRSLRRTVPTAAEDWVGRLSCTGPHGDRREPEATSLSLEFSHPLSGQKRGGADEVSKARDADEAVAAQQRLVGEKMPFDGCPGSSGPTAREPVTVTVHGGVLEAIIEMAASVLQSGFASPSHPQFPTLLLELHAFLSAWDQHAISRGVRLGRHPHVEENAAELQEDKWTQPDSCLTPGLSPSKENASSFAAGTTLAGGGGCRSVAPPDAAADERAASVPPAAAERLRALLRRRLRPALLTWLVENVHEVSDQMYNRLLPMLELLGAKEELLKALNDVALQGSSLNTAHGHHAAKVETPSVREKPDEDTGTLKICDGADIKLALRKSRAALLSLLLHHRERLTFQPPSLLSSLLRAAFPVSLIPHFSPADLAHGLTALQRLKAAAESPEDAAVAAFLASAIQGTSSVHVPDHSSKPCQAARSAHTGLDSDDKPGAKTSGNDKGYRVPPGIDDRSAEARWARMIIEDVPLQLIALLGRTNEHSHPERTKSDPSDTACLRVLPVSGALEHRDARTRVADFKGEVATIGGADSTEWRDGCHLQGDSIADDPSGSAVLGSQPEPEAPAADDAEACERPHRSTHGAENGAPARTGWDMLGSQQLAHAGTAAAQLLGLPSAAPFWVRMLERRIQPKTGGGDTEAPLRGGNSTTCPEFSGASHESSSTHGDIGSSLPNAESTAKSQAESAAISLLAPAAAAMTRYLLSTGPSATSSSTASIWTADQVGKSEGGTVSPTASPRGGANDAPASASPGADALRRAQSTKFSAYRGRIGEPNAPPSRPKARVKPLSSKAVRALVREKGDRLSVAGALRLLGGGAESHIVAHALAQDAVVLADAMQMLQGSQPAGQQGAGADEDDSAKQTLAAKDGNYEQRGECSEPRGASGRSPGPSLRVEGTAKLRRGASRPLHIDETPLLPGSNVQQDPGNDEKNVIRLSPAPDGAGGGQVSGRGDALKTAEWETPQSELLLQLQELGASYFLELVEQLAVISQHRLATVFQRSLNPVLAVAGDGRPPSTVAKDDSSLELDHRRTPWKPPPHVRGVISDLHVALTRLLLTMSGSQSLPLDAAASLVGPVISLLGDDGWSGVLSDATPGDSIEHCHDNGHARPAPPNEPPDGEPPGRDDLRQRRRRRGRPNIAREGDTHRSSEDDRCATASRPNGRLHMRGAGDIRSDSAAPLDPASRELKRAAASFLERMLPLVQEWLPRLGGHRGATLLHLLWGSSGKGESVPPFRDTSVVKGSEESTFTFQGDDDEFGGRTITGTANHEIGQLSGATAKQAASKMVQRLSSSEPGLRQESEAPLRMCARPQISTDVYSPGAWQAPVCRGALLHSLQQGALRTVRSLSPGALARLWEAFALQAHAAGHLPAPSADLNSEGMSLGLRRIVRAVTDKLVSLARCTAHGETPGNAACPGSMQTTRNVHNGEQRQRLDGKESEHQASGSGKEDSAGFSECQWLAGAVAAAGSGLLGSEEQQRIATAAARATPGSAAYFSLLAFIANSKSVPPAATSALVHELLTNAQLLMGQHKNSTRGSLADVKPGRTFFAGAGGGVIGHAESKSSLDTAGEALAHARSKEGGRLKRTRAKLSHELSAGNGRDPASPGHCLERNDGPGSALLCQKDVTSPVTPSSTGAAFALSERASTENPEGERQLLEPDVATAGWLLWTATQIHQRSLEYSADRRQPAGTADERGREKYSASRPFGAVSMRAVYGASGRLDSVLQSYLQVLLGELAQYRVHRAKENEESPPQQGSHKLSGCCRRPSQLYSQLIVSLDIVARIRQSFGQPESSGGYILGGLPRHPAIPDLLDGLTSLTNDRASDMSTSLPSDFIPGASRPSATMPRDATPCVSHRSTPQYSSLNALAYVLHLSRQARFFYPPLVEAVANAVASHRRTRLPAERAASLDSGERHEEPLQMRGKEAARRAHLEKDWQALLLLADAAVHQPQAALATLRRELLLLLDDGHTIQTLPLQHIVRVLRFALTARDPAGSTEPAEATHMMASADLATPAAGTALLSVQSVGVTNCKSRSRVADQSREDIVMASVAARCVKEGAPLLRELKDGRERGSFSQALMELEKQGYAVLGLIDTINKVRLLHMLSRRARQEGQSNRGTDRRRRLSSNALSTSLEAGAGSLEEPENRPPSTTPNEATSNRIKDPFAPLVCEEPLLESEQDGRRSSTAALAAGGIAETLRILQNEGPEWPRLLRAAGRHFLSKGSSGFHQTISTVLAHGLGVAHENEAWTPEGLSLDITLTAEAQDGRPVAVEVDGPTHFTEILRGAAPVGDAPETFFSVDGNLLASYSEARHQCNNSNMKEPGASPCTPTDQTVSSGRTTREHGEDNHATTPRATGEIYGRQYVPTALTQFKRQLLQATGWHVVSIPFFEWQPSQGVSESDGSQSQSPMRGRVEHTPSPQLLLLRRKLADAAPGLSMSPATRTTPQTAPSQSHARQMRARNVDTLLRVHMHAPRQSLPAAEGNIDEVDAGKRGGARPTDSKQPTGLKPGRRSTGKKVLHAGRMKDAVPSVRAEGKSGPSSEAGKQSVPSTSEQGLEDSDRMPQTRPVVDTTTKSRKRLRERPVETAERL